MRSQKLQEQQKIWRSVRFYYAYSLIELGRQGPRTGPEEALPIHRSHERTGPKRATCQAQRKSFNSLAFSLLGIPSSGFSQQIWRRALFGVEADVPKANTFCGGGIRRPVQVVQHVPLGEGKIKFGEPPGPDFAVLVAVDRRHFLAAFHGGARGIFQCVGFAVVVVIELTRHGEQDRGRTAESREVNPHSVFSADEPCIPAALPLASGR